MKQAYWLDPIHPAELLRTLLRALAGNAHLAVEGDAEVLGTLDLLSLNGATIGPSAPFAREYGAESAMVVLSLENRQQADLVCQVLAPGTQVAKQVGAIHIERHGCVEFLAGDEFHRECVCVGPSVPEELLRQLTRSGVIRGFYTPSQARKHFSMGEDEE